MPYFLTTRAAENDMQRRPSNKATKYNAVKKQNKQKNIQPSFPFLVPYLRAGSYVPHQEARPFLCFHPFIHIEKSFLIWVKRTPKETTQFSGIKVDLL